MMTPTAVAAVAAEMMIKAEMTMKVATMMEMVMMMAVTMMTVVTISRIPPSLLCYRPIPFKPLPRMRELNAAGRTKKYVAGQLCDPG
jgi:hypothetical protein